MGCVAACRYRKKLDVLDQTVEFAKELGAAPVVVRLPESDSWGSVKRALERAGELGSPSKRARR